MLLRDRLRYVAGTRPEPRRPSTLEPELPPGVLRGENEYGSVYFKDEFFPLDHLHGKVPLESALQADSTLLGRLGDNLTAADIREAAYLDIETTGLSGGTGTFAFLVGVGTFDNLGFRVRQFFLTEPSEEPALLKGLSDTLARCRSIVTFNGRSFDVPQLTTRFALSRQSAPFDLPHIDLLHPARRLYAHMLPSCRLAEVERHLLGLKRYGDVSGAMVPELYFSYIRRRNTRVLPPLFEHNSLDVLSLAGFLGHLNADAGSAIDAGAEHHLALGKWDEQRRRDVDAVCQYRRVLEQDSRTEIGGEAALRLARLLRRREGWQAGLEAWQAELATTASAIRTIRAHVEIAKLEEHRARRYQCALEHAEQASRLIEESRLLGFFAQTRMTLDKRIARLQRRTGALPPG
jgi:uncharacterized protein YprB with RNaseH-like and TPR domain